MYKTFQLTIDDMETLSEPVAGQNPIVKIWFIKLPLMLLIGKTVLIPVPTSWSPSNEPLPTCPTIDIQLRTHPNEHIAGVNLYMVK